MSWCSKQIGIHFKSSMKNSWYQGYKALHINTRSFTLKNDWRFL
uniref:Uncharacterized protein n=1 Tax=Rhizophora mucronata TaxID=61149 RepID=A0A2P2QVD2_RHIMU